MVATETPQKLCLEKIMCFVVVEVFQSVLLVAVLYPIRQKPCRILKSNRDVWDSPSCPDSHDYCSWLVMFLFYLGFVSHQILEREATGLWSVGV